MSWSTKKNKMNIEELDLNDLPNGYFQSASDMVSEDRGQSKLRNRNDKIHAELQDLAERNPGSKLSTFKVENGKYIVYHLRGLDISVKLVNR